MSLESQVLKKYKLTLEDSIQDPNIKQEQMNLFYDRGNMIEKWICGIESLIKRWVREMKLWFDFGNWTKKLKWFL